MIQHKGDLGRAEALYRQALAARPDCGAAESGLGNVPRERGRLEEALGHCKRVLQREPGYAIGHGDLGCFTAEFAGAYKVDTRYTDFFGRNATCAVDSILVRV